MPKRVQRKRAKGMPPGTVYVGRPSRWGNPFKGEDGAATATRQMLADDYALWIQMPTRSEPRTGSVHAPNGSTTLMGASYVHRPTVDEIRTALAGRDLACWCPLDQPCHADVLLELANSPAPVSQEGGNQ